MKLLLAFLMIPFFSFAEATYHEDSLYQLEDEWKDQNDKTMTLVSVKGQPTLLFMVYTKCRTACPLIVKDAKNLIKKLPKKYEDINVLVFSFDTTETKKTLSHFAETHKFKKNWHVLRGDEEGISTLAAVLGVNYKKLPDGEFVHSNSIHFMDKEGILKGKQDGLNKVDEKFVKEILKNI